jgi:NADH-quinone oxidoreductase subunit A
MIEQYFPILLFIFVGLAFGLGLPLAGATLSRVLRVHHPDPAKLSPYECGFEAFEDARMKFDVRYYLVAILFIIFDLDEYKKSVEDRVDLAAEYLGIKTR